MAESPVDLWRALHSDDFPDGPVVNDEPLEGILWPLFERKQIGANKDGSPRYREPDVNTAAGLVQTGGGTSLFDKKGVFRGKSWSYFHIPKGTVVDPNLVFKGPDYNKRFSANHYQLEPCQPMFPNVLKGALDNLARAALAKKHQNAHG